jgi:hypothetical protein
MLFLSLYLVWCSYSTILLHQVFFSTATYVEAFGKVENRFKSIYFFLLKILKPKLIDSYKWTDLAIVRHSSGPMVLPDCGFRSTAPISTRRGSCSETGQSELTPGGFLLMEECGDF